MTRQIAFFWKTLKSLTSKLYVQASVSNYKNFSVGSNKKQLLIIPGLRQSIDSWIKVANLLSKNFNVTILELPNQGLRINKTAGWDETDFANYASNFIKKHFKKKILLLGHSLGGKTAAIVSVQSRDSIQHLFLYAVGGITTKPTIITTITDLIKKLLFPMNQSMNLVETYKKLSVSTTLIYGQYDLVTPSTMGKQIAGMIKNSSFILIPNTTHLAHEEEPDIFTQIIINSVHNPAQVFK